MIRRKKKAQVTKRGVGDTATEERTTRTIRGETVTIRRGRSKPKRQPPADKPKESRRRGRRGGSESKAARQQPEEIEPPASARKQMLVRTLPHQVQIVIMEGPVLVEHYVAKSDQESLVGNVYIGKVRNVLPGMEAAFVDFGVGKNGVLYAGDVRTASGGRPRRIEQALSVGDEVMVQVTKDPMGHKGARLSGVVSLAGRYLVLSPGGDIRGISRRLSDAERDRLREIIAKIRPAGFGVIARTAAEEATEDDLRGDMERLEAAWEDIDSKAKQGGAAPRSLYEEPPLVIRVIREHFNRSFRRLLVDAPATYDTIVGYLKGTEPDLASKVSLYKDEISLFERFHVDDQIRKGLDRKVWLESGGHIVIERTEALTVIDVNTGKFVGHSNLEDTVLQNNLEAAEEIAHQLRLRDIGGIIVIDFIDMEVAANRLEVLDRLRSHLAKDRTRTQVFEVSELGLVEMTRKNVSAGLVESFSQVCEHCGGRGVVLFEDAATTGSPMPGDAVVEAGAAAS
jgi:ribonuclease E